MVLCNCRCNSFDWLKFVQDLGPVIISAIALLVSYYLTKKTLELQKATALSSLNAQKDLETRQNIQKKLDQFYGPILQLIKKSTLLYTKLREEHLASDPHFKTLTYLLDGNKFHGNDKILIESILKIGEECENLIHANAGLIDDRDLVQNVIPRATTHFLILRLAYQGVLSGNAEKFKDLTFPRDLEPKLEARKKELENELQLLKQRSS